MNIKQNKGFTFIEVLIAVALTLAIATLTMVNYGRQKPYRDLSSTKLKMVAVLRDASTRSSGQSLGASWGVHIQASSTANSFFTLFYNSYASGTVQQFVALPSTLRFDTSTFPSGTTDITFNKITGRANTSTFVRAYIAGDPTKSFIVWIDSSGLVFEGSSTNVGVGKTASQISTWGTSTASLAVDGNTDGDWTHNSVSHTATGGQDWWQVDLGQNYHIEKVNVWNRTDGCPITCDRLKDYYVLVSNTPFVGTLSSTLATTGIWANHQTTTAGRPTTVPVGAQGRYVAVWIANANYLHVGEVEVFGQ